MKKIVSSLTLSVLLGAAAPLFAGDAGLGAGLKVGDAVNVDVNASAKEAAAKKEKAETKANEASAKVEAKKEEVKAGAEEKKDEAKAKADEGKQAAETHAKKGKKKLKAGVDAATGALPSVDVNANASAGTEKK